MGLRVVSAVDFQKSNLPPMNWIKANKFLSGFLGVMLIAAGALTFLLLTAKAKYGEVSENLDTQATELNRLQSLVPFPDEANAKAMAGQKGEHQQAIVALQKNLGANELPIESLTPEQFQDRLREAVIRVKAKATGGNVALPEKGFFMGFDRYEDAPPRPEVAPVLGRDLKAMELAINLLIDSRISGLTSLERAPLAEEGDGIEGRNTPSGGQEGRKTGSPLVTKHAFEVRFLANHPQFVRALNEISHSKEQFFIPRLITVANTELKGPPKVDPNVPTFAPSGGLDPAPVATPSPTGANSAPKPPAAARRYIVGEEKVDATLRLEIVDFAEPATK